MKDKYILTAESVTAGHPDKLCDTIADNVLDACLKDDPPARVACEVLATAGKILVAGELRTTAQPDVEAIVNGYIQTVEPFADSNVLLVCNEDGKIIGLPENRFLRNRNGIPYDIIHGTFFLAQGSGEEFCSLTDKQIQTYTRLYSREKLFVMQHGKVINQPKKGKATHER